MQIALIGIGKIANYQMQAITHTPGIKLIDAHDLDPNKAEELPGSVQFHENLEKMLQKSKADAFLVSTPTWSHFEVAMQVIESDRIAIVEKPLCTSTSEMEALFTAAKTRKQQVSQIWSVAIYSIVCSVFCSAGTTVLSRWCLLF